MKVTLIAAPLITKGGVFRSTCELVAAARAQGLDWSAIIITRGHLAPGELPSGVEVMEQKFTGIRGIVDTWRSLHNNQTVASSGALISMIPQTDMVLALLPRIKDQLRIAFVRGAAWPRKGEAGETKRLIWRAIERQALRRLNAVWATTTVLRDEIEWPAAQIVPAGIELNFSAGTARSADIELIWAARMSVDKNPELFLDVVENTKLTGNMYGDGKLRSTLESKNVDNLHFHGWIDPKDLWRDGQIYLGTSHREAFGRSAVEAAAAGLPVVLSTAFGVAPFLFTDEEMKRNFVLDPLDNEGWIRASSRLAESAALRAEVSTHVQQNALLLSIEESVKSVQKQLVALRQSLGMTNS